MKRLSDLSSLCSITRRDSSCILVESLSGWWSSDSSVSSRSNSNNSGVNCTRDTVVDLVVHLWDWIFVVNRSFRDISDSCCFNHVSDSHSLDCLILWNTSGTVNTSDWLDVTSTVLVSTVGCSLLWHIDCI